jgi:DNA (cytosine-5)-methyltransferase 1
MSGNSTVTAVSLFSGVGGLDLAARALGIAVDLATDVDGTAMELHRRALGSKVLVGDIGALLVTGQLAAGWSSKDSPTLVMGGPPCTPFSHAGFWLDEKRNGMDPASFLLVRFAEAVELFAPKAFLLENVPGLAFKTHREKLGEFRCRMTRAGYTLTEQVLSAATFAIPQRRRRLFVAGVRGDLSVSLDHWPAFPVRTAGAALEDLPFCSPEPDEHVPGHYGKLLHRVPPGGNYLRFTERYGYDPPLFKNRGRYWSFLLKIDPERPAPTLPAQRVTYNGPFHWDSRHLRAPEIARLQGFPDGYPTAANLQETRRHLGNAVPPALGMAVLWRVLASLDLADAKNMPPALRVWSDDEASYGENLRKLAEAASAVTQR